MCRCLTDKEVTRGGRVGVRGIFIGRCCVRCASGDDSLNGELYVQILGDFCSLQVPEGKREIRTLGRMIFCMGVGVHVIPCLELWVDSIFWRHFNPWSDTRWWWNGLPRATQECLSNREVKGWEEAVVARHGVSHCGELWSV